MGANIGTSVTNTIVAMMQAGDRNEFRRYCSSRAPQSTWAVSTEAAVWFSPLRQTVSSVFFHFQGFCRSHGPRLLQLAVGADPAAPGGRHRRPVQTHRPHDQVLQHPDRRGRPRPAQRHHRPAHRVHHRGRAEPDSQSLFLFLVCFILPRTAQELRLI